MHNDPARVSIASVRSKWPLSFHANTQPTHTGTIAAGKVFGRAASRHGIRNRVTRRIMPHSTPDANSFPQTMAESSRVP